MVTVSLGKSTASLVNLSPKELCLHVNPYSDVVPPLSNSPKEYIFP